MQYSKNQFLMWTDITITVNANKNPLMDMYDAFAIFYSFEKEFSRFSENSELSLLNKSREQEVSDRFIDILNLSIKVYHETNHYFNPLINLSNLWYSGDFWKWVFEKSDSIQNLDLDKISIFWNFVSLKENQNLDFWWIVKWYTVDLCSQFLKTKWYNDFIINAGWDIYISGNNNKWKTPVVAIGSPFNNTDIFAIMELKDESISTSWTYKRKWNIDNNNYHHIINPISESNNNEIISVSIIHEKCIFADAYATTCIAMWIEKSLTFLNEKDIDWVIIWSDWMVYKTEWIEKYNFEVI